MYIDHLVMDIPSVFNVNNIDKRVNFNSPIIYPYDLCRFCLSPQRESTHKTIVSCPDIIINYQELNNFHSMHETIFSTPASKPLFPLQAQTQALYI